MDSPTNQRPSAPPVGDASLAPTNNGYVSLEGMHRTVDVPHHDAGFLQQWRAFVGPAILVSVGYMDPGNWGTDLQAARSTNTACSGWSDSPA